MGLEHVHLNSRKLPLKTGQQRQERAAVTQPGRRWVDKWIGS